MNARRKKKRPQAYFWRMKKQAMRDPVVSVHTITPPELGITLAANCCASGRVFTEIIYGGANYPPK